MKRARHLDNGIRDLMGLDGVLDFRLGFVGKGPAIPTLRLTLRNLGAFFHHHIGESAAATGLTHQRACTIGDSLPCHTQAIGEVDGVLQHLDGIPARTSASKRAPTLVSIMASPYSSPTDRAIRRACSYVSILGWLAWSRTYARCCIAWLRTTG